MQFHHVAPSKGTKTGRVWDIAERISFEKMRVAKRQEVIDAFASEGGNANTASTQYSQWKSSFDEKRLQNLPATKSRVPVALNVAATRLEMGRDGRILVPLEMRSALRLENDLMLTAEVHDGVLTLMSPRTAMIKLQNLVRQQDKGTGSVVDALLAERRTEAKAE
ncbi:MAG TPA: hypothetical protein VIJ49_02265 [Aestuariivirga sp.]